MAAGSLNLRMLSSAKSVADILLRKSLAGAL